MTPFHQLSGWPSGLRRQTQGKPYHARRGRVFWSTNVGVGSNPTSDKTFSFIYFFLYIYFVMAVKFYVSRKYHLPTDLQIDFVSFWFLTLLYGLILSTVSAVAYFRVYVLARSRRGYSLTGYSWTPRILKTEILWSSTIAFFSRCRSYRFGSALIRLRQPHSL